MNTFRILKLILLLAIIHIVSIRALTCEAEKVIFINSPEDYHIEDISEKILSASTNTRIIIAPGSYLLNNPIIIDKNDIHILGNSRENTFFYPKNPGDPVFVLKADNIVFRDITINAKVIGGNGHANFAVYIEKNTKKIEISKTRILETGASSIIGHQADDITISGNLIINAGDDAIQIRGSDLKIIDNIIIRYFDEAIDISGGKNHVVTGNYVESGRIGIVLDSSVNALVQNNTVKDNIQEGIVTDTEKEGSVIGNVLINNGANGFKLFSPTFVASNKIFGNHDIGLKIFDMDKGTLENNLILDSNYGIKLYNSTNSSIKNNKYCIRNIPFVNEKVNESAKNSKENNKIVCSEGSGFKKKYLISILIQKDTSDIIKRGKIIASVRSEDNVDIGIEGGTNKDKQIAEDIARFLKKNNPGFLSIEVNNETMKSLVTDKLFNILKGSGDLGIGLVRWPYLMFKARSTSLFPEWHLEVGGQSVALITNVTTGPNVKMYIKNNGKLNFIDTLMLLKDHCLSRLQHFFNKPSQSALKNMDIKRISDNYWYT